VIDRIDATVQRLHDLFEVHEMRAAERAEARAIALAPAQAQITLALTLDVLQALHALLVAPPIASNGVAAHVTGPTPPSPRCPEHGAMRESTKKPGTWFCTQKLTDGTYCASKA